MSYSYNIVADYPVASYPMNANEPGFVDVSGNDRTATNYGTLKPFPPLVAYGGQAYLVSNTNGFSFPCPVFQQTVAAFSLEVWFKPRDAGTIEIVGHDHAGDGIVYDGEKISFVTEHVSGGNAVVSYFPDDLDGAFHVVAVCTGQKNQLYVNGQVRAETTLSDDQMAGFLTQTSMSRLFVGHAIAGNPSAVVDAVSVYSYALTQPQVLQHFSWGRDTYTLREASATNKGSLFTFSDETAALAYQQRFEGEDWELGMVSGCAITEGLTPFYNETGLSETSMWRWGIPVSVVGDSIKNSKIEWNGDGSFQVDASLDDGSTWTPCSNGRQIPDIDDDFVVDDRTLIVQITFPAGSLVSLPSIVRNLTVKFYSSNTYIPDNGPRTAALVGAVSPSSSIHQPIEYHDDFGLDFYGGYVKISADASEAPLPVRTIDMWFNPSQTKDEGQFLFTFRIGTTATVPNVYYKSGVLNIPAGSVLYVNGAVYKSGTVIEPNQWTHLVCVGSENAAGFITVGANHVNGERFTGQIGNVTLYPTALTDVQAKRIYAQQMGMPIVTVSDSASLGILDASIEEGPAKVYSFDWSISGAG